MDEAQSWTNYQTWLVARFFRKNKWYSKAVEERSALGDEIALALWFQNTAKRIVFEEEEYSPLVTQLLTRALADVNWREIASRSSAPMP